MEERLRDLKRRLDPRLKIQRLKGIEQDRLNPRKMNLKMARNKQLDRNIPCRGIACLAHNSVIGATFSLSSCASFVFRGALPDHIPVVFSARYRFDSASIDKDLKPVSEDCRLLYVRLRLVIGSRLVRGSLCL